MTRCGSGLCLCGARAECVRSLPAGVGVPGESCARASRPPRRSLCSRRRHRSRAVCAGRGVPLALASPVRDEPRGERSLRQPRGGDALALALALAAAALTCSHLGFATCGQGAADRFSSQWFLLVVPTGTELCKCRRTAEGAVSSAPQTSKRRRKHAGPRFSLWRVKCLRPGRGTVPHLLLCAWPCGT